MIGVSPYPARPAFAGAAGARRRREVARRVQRHRTNGAGRAVDLRDLGLAFNEIALADELQSLLAGELFRPFRDEQHVPRFLQHPSRKPHGIFDAVQMRRRTRRTGAPVHDGGIQIVPAIHVEVRATPGIETSGVFQHAHRRLDGVQRAAVTGQNGLACEQRGFQSRAHVGGFIVGVRLGPTRVGTAVDQESVRHDRTGCRNGRRNVIRLKQSAKELSVQKMLRGGWRPPGAIGSCSRRSRLFS